MQDVTLDALGLIIMLAAPAYLLMQPLALIRLRGGWRLAAAAPLLLAVPTILWSLYALSHGSNLWPITFILFAPFGAAWLILLLLARRAMGG